MIVTEFGKVHEEREKMAANFENKTGRTAPAPRTQKLARWLVYIVFDIMYVYITVVSVALS